MRQPILVLDRTGVTPYLGSGAGCQLKVGGRDPEVDAVHPQPHRLGHTPADLGFAVHGKLMDQWYNVCGGE